MLSEKAALSLIRRNSVLGVFANCRHIYRQLFTSEQVIINDLIHKWFVNMENSVKKKKFDNHFFFSVRFR